MPKVLLTGGTGVVGLELTRRLRERGYDVVHLSRIANHEATTPAYAWNPSKHELEPEALDGVDAIVHLAGANIGERRWTAQRQREIRDSRVKSAQLILDKVNEMQLPLQVFITASAVGYYGAMTSDKIFTEEDAPASDFIGETCQLWEAAADAFAAQGIRTVKIRTGVVLTKQGGALQKMLLPIRLGVATPLGSGAQYLPWIHISDLCDIYIQALEDTRMRGAYNAASPQYINNRDFTKTTAFVLNKPFWNISVPAFFLKIIFGEMADIILQGSRVSADKILQSGFQFKFPQLENALKDLLKK